MCSSITPHSECQENSYSAFIHSPHNYITWIPELKADGSNFQDWMTQLDLFICFIFDFSDFTHNYLNHTLQPQENKALRYLIQKRIDIKLLDLVKDEKSAAKAIIILQNYFHYLIQNHQLELFLQLMDCHHRARSQNKGSTAMIPKYFSLFKELRQTGLNIPQNIKSIFIQTAIPPPPNFSQDEWFEFMTSKMKKIKSCSPKDVHKMMYTYFHSHETEMRPVEKKEFIKGKTSTYASTASLVKSFRCLDVQATESKENEDKEQGKSSNNKPLRPPNMNEISQALLNIEFGNKQPDFEKQMKYGIQCHYCKLHGHWKYTCPFIPEIENLPQAPLPM
ncbi:hypothetical protein O181_049030 [Austropuccinia psidii MF-1]|uniref:Uncharacterized protein n=1 Tax=Austropuccinia psidii MF-1 TaxID=1389203 RepID=A0A9Q3DYD1_9BASI|nr:hypothetical protein [Austropuccinia psidii MF-1]